jgi:hypothetical protein
LSITSVAAPLPATKWRGWFTRWLDMRAIVAGVGVGVACAACGARPAASRAVPRPAVASTPMPARVDAGSASDEVGDGGACAVAASLPMRVAGHNAPVRLLVCELGEQHPCGDERAADGFVLRDRRADLVLDRVGDPVTTTLATWQDSWQRGGAWTLIGVLVAPGGEGAMVVKGESSGPSPDLAGVDSVVRVMAVRGGVWEVVHQTEAPVVDPRLSADGRVLTVDTCDDGDGATFELRWDGQAVRATL